MPALEQLGMGISHGRAPKHNCTRTATSKLQLQMGLRISFLLQWNNACGYSHP